MTYKEIVYFVLDSLKLVSDDSHFTESHVLFLADKMRAMLLKQRYSDIRKEVPESNYQTICVPVERTDAVDGKPCTGADYLKSKDVIPNMMQIGSRTVSSAGDFFQGNFGYVNNERFKYVGHNPFLKNQIYSTIAPDKHLYLKSGNPQIYYITRVRVTGIFEDSSKAAELSCDKSEDGCDVLDQRFPIEDSLVPDLIQLCVKDLAGTIYQPADSENDAADNLSKLANYIARNLKERRG